MKSKFITLKSKVSELFKQKSFKRYLFVGFSSVFIDLLIFALLREKLTGGLFSAVSIAYWSSVIYNFSMNRNWTFNGAKGMVFKQMFQYGILLLINYATTLLIITVLHNAGISEYLGKVVALAITISWTYIIYDKYIFKK